MMNLPSPSSGTMATTQEETPCYCNIHVFSETEKKRHSELMQKLKDATLETIEAADGFAFRLEPKSVSILEVAEWITYERHCCTFFNFEIELQPNGRALWLKLGGGENVKEFLRPDVERNAVFEPKF